MLIRELGIQGGWDGLGARFQHWILFRWRNPEANRPHLSEVAAAETQWCIASVLADEDVGFSERCYI